MANSADTLLYLINEVTQGTTPLTPVFRQIENTQHDITINSSMLNSEVLKANRAPSDPITQGYYVNGSIAGEFKRDSTIDSLMESGFGGTFTSNVLKAGNVDKYLTIQQVMTSSAGGKLYFTNTGSIVSSFGVSLDAQSRATFSTEFVGMAQTSSAALMSGATYVAPIQGLPIAGGTTGSVTIAGLTATFYSLDFSITHQRSPRFGLFTPNSLGTSTGGNRTATLNLRMYRDDLNPEAVFIPNTPIPVTFALGNGANNVYTFNSARMFANRPARSTNENDEMVDIVLTAAGDNTAGTDFSVTKS